MLRHGVSQDVCSKLTGDTMAPLTTRFWHLSDLHLQTSGESGEECHCKGHACATAIKRDLLQRIGRELQLTHKPPALLLLTGDLFDGTADEANRAVSYLEPVLAAARARGTEVHGILGDKGHDGDVRNAARRLGWKWLMSSGEQRTHSSGVKIVGVSQDDERAVGAAVSKLRTPDGPSILLAHTGEVAASNPFNYRALGHIHTASIVRVDERHLSGRPGHLYSYWDGPGKAWPVFMIAGTIDASTGAVDAWRVPLETPPFSAPATRQIYGDVGGFERRSGALYLVHAPTEPSLYEASGLQAQYVEFLPRTGAVTATFRFSSKGERDDIFRRILEACPNDVFVTPSPGKRAEDRIADWGCVLMSDSALFHRFVKESFKRLEGTQTSDR